MNKGAFVCSCAGTCDIDLEEAREQIEDVEVAASSRLLCQDKLDAFETVIDEYELDEMTVTCPEAKAQEKITAAAENQGLYPESVQFVDQREGAGWVHDEQTATAKTARLVNAAQAGSQTESLPRSSIHRAEYDVVVVGDPDAAAAIADSADVTLLANGQELAGTDADLENVDVERGRVVNVDGTYSEFEITVRARVTDDCISCMKCVHEGPDGMVTRYPVDIDPDAPVGEWVNVCPTDAIEMGGVERTLECDQVIYPGGDDGTIGGQRGFHTTVDAATIDEVERLLGGFEVRNFLDLEMDVCASGTAGEMGCNECVEACPHGAVERAAIDEVEFHLDSCQNCGACTSACPTGATSLDEPSNERIAREVEALLSSDDDGGFVSGLLGGSSASIETPIVAFVCSEQAGDALREYGRMAAAGRADIEYPPILPVSVNCADTVGEAHVLHALAAGADGVAIVGCGGSCLHSGPDPKAELVERVNQATTDLGLGERVSFFAPDPTDPDAFVEEVSEFAEVELEASPVPAGEHEATGQIDEERPNPDFDNHGWALESVRAILEHAEPQREVIRGLKDFGIVEVGDGCTLTPTCTNYCPTDALRRTDDGLEFNHERCVNCELCEEVCVEGVIEVEDGLDLSLLPENRDDEVDPAWTEVHEGTMQACAGCGREFTSEATVAAIEDRIGERVAELSPTADRSIIEYCPECRANLLHER
ncbi:hydrogenase iron-sulfur subunit [Natronorubrum daqingense]|uniref:Coenzyme F420-reducing hydrogenase, delta subunit n=1 Tax=Natronorubrum daqingense TaxID=588898 RepID=A0A1N7CRC1_9EURY|nr:hydrogenase iron-sulfur subunit [Natronorubrum daqingense]APX98217.1 ferridoxin [Natronorubrum daqingense]SIR65975.1 Coenzyme F420-reducing hydrogenase, delta subunit [Natronorubrum daqingense]